MRNADSPNKATYMDMAVTDLRKALELEPKDRDLRIQLSLTLFDAEKYNEAIEGTFLILLSERIN